MSETVKKYRNLPATVEAVRLSVENMSHVEDWSGGSIRGTLLPPEERIIEIQTEEGEKEVKVGDWIVRNASGDRCVLKHDVFTETYVPADPGKMTPHDTALARAQGLIAGLRHQDLCLRESVFRVLGFDMDTVEGINEAEAYSKANGHKLSSVVAARLDEVSHYDVPKTPSGYIIVSKEYEQTGRGTLMLKQGGGYTDVIDEAQVFNAVDALEHHLPCVRYMAPAKWVYDHAVRKLSVSLQSLVKVSYPAAQAVISATADTISDNDIACKFGIPAEELVAKLRTPVSELGLRVRSSNCLCYADITSTLELVTKTQKELMSLRAFGKTSLRDVECRLKELGLSLGMRIPGNLKARVLGTT